MGGVWRAGMDEWEFCGLGDLIKCWRDGAGREDGLWRAGYWG